MVADQTIETSDRSDGSLNQAERDDIWDNFDGPRQKPKRKRTSEGASVAAPKDDQSLIGLLPIWNLSA
ncbi:hypothetical protein U1Q18_023042 [Sarracenia purpurea var. burkii]